MNREDRYIKILKWLNRNSYRGQRVLARETEMSLGTLNSMLKAMEKEGYLKKEKDIYYISDKGGKYLDAAFRSHQRERLVLEKDREKIHTAVVLAAGDNENFSCPEGLLKLPGTTVMDRILKILQKHGMDRIIMIVGAKEEQYRRYYENRNIILVSNPRYKWTGTMASLSLAAPYVKGDFLLVESNQIFEEAAVEEVLEAEAANGMVITVPSGSRDEAYVELGEDRTVFRISKDIRQLNRIDGEAVGISKITGRLFAQMLDYYKGNRNPMLNYEYVLEGIGRIYGIEGVMINDLAWTVIENEHHYQMVKNWLYPRIMRREQKASEQRAREVLADCLKIDGKEIKEVRVGGGMTNSNFIVKCQKEWFILRVPGVCTGEMIDRKRESHNSDEACRLGLNPENIYFDPETGIKVTKYIKDGITLNGKTARLEYSIQKTTEILRRLHNAKIQMEGKFSVKEEYEKYKEMIERRKTPYYEGFDRMDRLFYRLMDRLDEMGTDRRPCHNDLVPENFVMSGEGKMYLIDWEYSGYNDPMWDLASHLLECNFDRREEELFFQYYFRREIKKEEAEKILIYKICQDILWSAWTILKENDGDDFGTYGRDRLKRAAILGEEYRNIYEKRNERV
ncbi:MAG: phosphotransferase [Ruminococcus sp.]